MNFDEKTLFQLDYFRIKENIASFCFSLEGKSVLLDRKPFTDKDIIQQLKTESYQWSLFINSAKKIPLSCWEPILPITDILGVSGSTLQIEELASVFNFCKISVETVQAITSAAISLPISNLLNQVQKIPNLSPLIEIINRVLDKNGQLKDLPELREIRGNISKLRREIDSIIHSYTSDSSLRDFLQSDVPALRADRQVLAIKSGSKNKIKGIVHEVSQTGQTVYIEPEDVVRKNNELVQEEFRLSAEIRRILKEVTSQLASFKDDLLVACKILVHLDTTCAAARWGIEIHGTYSLICEKNQNPKLLQARHPLLKEKAIPIDVVFPEGCKIIIITGPNTGGKTVTLKTLALFVLLNQSGFPIPVAEGTCLPICSGVFADIGDEQSLDQSLSTFSGHMKNVADMLNRSDSDSLVLLDELGSGTDPLEGGAIAMAILDSLINKGCYVLVTTHHGVLKNYGYTQPSCINASAEFNEETLAPTYRIRTGIPGESHALDIARRNGLPSCVADKAESYIAGEQADVSAMIRGLTLKHEEADKFQRELIIEQQQIREKRRAVDLKELQLRQRELQISQNDHREARLFLAENRKMLENLVRELREGEITQQKTKAVKQFISDLAKNVENQEEKLVVAQEELEQDFITVQEKYKNEPIAEKNKKNKKRLKNRDALKQAKSVDLVNFNEKKENVGKENNIFQEGSEVITKSGMKGTLIRLDGKNNWLVQIGSMKMTIKEKDLTLISSSVPITPTISVELSSSNSESNSERPVIELRLLGMRQDEAIKSLEKQLDLASMHNLHSFSIIHGKGNGVLQQAVHDYLSHYPNIAGFQFASPEDGGTGKTYVQLNS